MDIGEDYSHLYAGEINKSKKKVYTDGLTALAKKQNIDMVRLQIRKSHHNISALLLRGERTSFFVTEDSGRYISPLAYQKQEQHYERINAVMRFDSVHVRYQKRHIVGEMYTKHVAMQTSQIFDAVSNYRAALRITMSPVRMYQVSIGGAMILGMVSMSMIYQNLGPSAFAEGLENAMNKNDDTKEVVRVIENVDDNEGSDGKSDVKEDIKKQQKETESDKKQDDGSGQAEIEDTDTQKAESVIMADIVPKNTEISGAEDQKVDEKKDESTKKSVDSAVKKEESAENQNTQGKTFEELAYEVTEGHPIQKMLPYILEQDPEVAKYFIAISKQESGFGERVPLLNGQDCYNYLGYRGRRKLMGTGQHTCFNSRKDAVETICKRLHTLIYDNDQDTARELVGTWKCGSKDCAGHSKESVDRWVSTVGSTYDQLSQK
ncbi:MAG: hypothetical protein WC819_06275 [Parcubacteria group bacterium]|jgi:hypothetical protein